MQVLPQGLDFKLHFLAFCLLGSTWQSLFFAIHVSPQDFDLGPQAFLAVSRVPALTIIKQTSKNNNFFIFCSSNNQIEQI